MTIRRCERTDAPLRPRVREIRGLESERARVLERVFGFRDGVGRTAPQRPRFPMASLYNGAIRKGEHARVLLTSTISGATEPDVWLGEGRERQGCLR